MQGYWKSINKEMKKDRIKYKSNKEWDDYYGKNRKRLLSSYVDYAKKFGTIRTLGEEIMRDEKISKAAKHVEKICGKELDRDVLVFRYNRRQFVPVPDVYSDDNGPVLVRFLKTSGESDARHELIHASDRSSGGPLNADSLRQGKFDYSALKMYAEGRAYYGQNLGKKSHLFLRSLFSYTCKAMPAVIAIGMTLVCSARSFGAISPDTWAAFAVALGASFWNRKNAIRNYTFFHAIRKIAKEVGDGITAFKITSEKVPTTMKELKNPLIFYKDEIAREKAKQAGVAPN